MKDWLQGKEERGVLAVANTSWSVVLSLSIFSPFPRLHPSISLSLSGKRFGWRSEKHTSSVSAPYIIKKMDEREEVTVSDR